MVIDLILAGIVVLGLIGIVSILVRKFPMLSSIDTEAIPAEREAKVKQGLIERRLERKFGILGSRAFGWSGTAIQFLRLAARRGYWKLREVEREYRQRARLQLSPSQRAELQRKVSVLLEEAQTELNAERFAEAEKRCIEAVALEPKSLAAYRLLGDVYLASKDYLHASEVYGHSIELSRRTYRVKGLAHRNQVDAQEYGGHTSDVAELYFDQSLAFRQLARLPEATRSCEEACRLVPNHPKFLHTLLELALDAKEKPLAQRTLAKLKEANPENQRLSEFEAQVKAL
jgi:tetratricopeptide (TPR) repeat protein